MLQIFEISGVDAVIMCNSYLLFVIDESDEVMLFVRGMSAGLFVVVYYRVFNLFSHNYW